jgi:hypothetical protein
MTRNIFKKLQTLPTSLQSEIFEWDPTFRLLFRQCLVQLRLLISQKLSKIYLHSTVVRNNGYFEFSYSMPIFSYVSSHENHRVFIEEYTCTSTLPTLFNNHTSARHYLLRDFNTETGFFSTQFIFI